MRRLVSITIISLIIAILSASYAPAFTIRGGAAETPWQKGASIESLSSTDFASSTFQQSLQNLKNTGANYVSFIIPYYQSTNTSSNIYAGKNTPSDQALISAITYAHSLGLKVMLKPHLESLEDPWRAHIEATDRVSWFTNYRTMLTHLADIAGQYNVESICIGTELISMATYTSNPDNTGAWIFLIESVRARYSGELTYSANWGGNYFSEEVPHIGFWPYLDVIGISAYYPHALEKEHPTVQDIVASWDVWNTTKIKPLYEQYKKPILFSEIGYRSKDSVHRTPWDGMSVGHVDEREQAVLYEGLFSYWNKQPHFAGVELWGWSSNPDAGGPSNDLFTPQHKEAERIMSTWFGGILKPQQTLSADISILFPSNKSTVNSGVQIFKIETESLYTPLAAVYWQVDGGALNLMQDNKAYVDVSHWTWKGKGPYAVNFVAKNSNGTILAQKVVSIFVQK